MSDHLKNIAFGLSDHRVHAVFWRGRIWRLIEWFLPFLAADELLCEIEPIRSHFLLSRSQPSASYFYEFSFSCPGCRNSLVRVGIFGSVVFFLWRHRLVCPRANIVHTFTWQDASSHVDPLVATCGRVSIVSLCAEGCEIHFNSD